MNPWKKNLQLTKKATHRVAHHLKNLLRIIQNNDHFSRLAVALQKKSDIATFPFHVLKVNESCVHPDRVAPFLNSAGVRWKDPWY